MTSQASPDPAKRSPNAWPAPAEVERWLASEIDWGQRPTASRQWSTMWQMLERSNWCPRPMQRAMALCWAGVPPQNIGVDFDSAWKDWCQTQVAEFASGFFLLPPADRLKRWTVLNEMCQGLPGCQFWLQHLRNACQVEIMLTAQPTGKGSDLIALLCRLATVSPVELPAEIGLAWKRLQETPAEWLKALIELRRVCPPLCQSLPLLLRSKLVELSQQKRPVPSRGHRGFKSFFPNIKRGRTPRSTRIGDTELSVGAWAGILLCLCTLIALPALWAPSRTRLEQRERESREQARARQKWLRDQYALLPQEAWEYSKAPPHERTAQEIEVIITQLMDSRIDIERVTRQSSRYLKELIERAKQDLQEARAREVVFQDRPAAPDLPESAKPEKRKLYGGEELRLRLLRERRLPNP